MSGGGNVTAQTLIRLNRSGNYFEKLVRHDRNIAEVPY